MFFSICRGVGEGNPTHLPNQLYEFPQKVLFPLVDPTRWTRQLQQLLKQQEQLQRANRKTATSRQRVRQQLREIEFLTLPEKEEEKRTRGNFELALTEIELNLWRQSTSV